MADITGEQPQKNTEEKPKSILEQTNEAIKRLEEQNERMEKNIRELANEKLAGTSGEKVEVEPKKEISPEDYSKKALAGEIGDDKEE